MSLNYEPQPAKHVNGQKNSMYGVLICQTGENTLELWKPRIPKEMNNRFL